MEEYFERKETVIDEGEFESNDPRENELRSTYDGQELIEIQNYFLS